MSGVSGKTLIDWGFKPGDWFKDAIRTATVMWEDGASEAAILDRVRAMAPEQVAKRAEPLPYSVFLDAENEVEAANRDAVLAHMDALMRVPTIVGGAVMPDACPAGSEPGTIPVGGAVACENAIHPGFHSADVCCSVAISIFRERMAPFQLLDAVQKVTHFGPGARKDPIMTIGLQHVMKRLENNPLLRDLEGFALGNFATQGDGNHFAYVGEIASSGSLALVTHHGSRGLGASLYRRGMALARRHTNAVADEIPGYNAWIKASSQDGEDYWSALQVVREWTRESHFAIHDMAANLIGNRVEYRFWNEHNFVFQKSDGLFYHGKGATPSWAGFSPDDNGLTLIPLNMSEPILITSHRDKPESLGFAPHGAGRNSSRTKHMKVHGDALVQELTDLQSQGLDIRSYCGVPDLSELPSAYKNAAAVRAQIDRYDLARVVDQVVPYGSIMAGDWQRDAPWRKKSGR